MAAAPKKAFLKASFQEDKASLLICIHRGMAAAASRCMLAASMPLNAPLVLDMVAMAEASRCTVLSEVWCSEHLLCIRTCDGVTYACSLPATLLHLHDLTSTMYPWTVQNLTSAINKKNEERTAARVANTGKVLRTVSSWHAGPKMCSECWVCQHCNPGVRATPRSRTVACPRLPAFLVWFLQAVASNQLPVVVMAQLLIVCIQVQQLPVKASAEQKKRAKAAK